MKKPIKPLEELLDSVRDIEGFPIGKDEDILALSAPPYYTACPNPYINDFVKEYGTPYDEERDDYHREPFVGDVSEGKSDASYMAYSYHTKVPYKAITKYIKHYTNESDLILDGFCGTGMSGLASAIEGRYAILSDLSPLASCISHATSNSFSVKNIKNKISEIISILENDLKWIYQTTHLNTYGKINYVVLSEVYECPYCNKEYIYWDLCVDISEKKVSKDYKCSCNAIINKGISNRKLIEYYDKSIDKKIKISKRVPVLIVYNVGKKMFQKKPDEFDRRLFSQIEEYKIPDWYPTKAMMGSGAGWGDTYRTGIHTGITNVQHFFSKRSLIALSKINNLVKDCPPLIATFLSILPRSSIRNRYMPQYGNRHVGTLSGTLYVPSFTEESNVINLFKNKTKSVQKLLSIERKTKTIVSINGSTDQSLVNDNCVDYIFTDPPFGDNIMYSELNYIGESWLKIVTDNNSEAIINTSQNKSLLSYISLMRESFSEYYRVLKPNRWITVVFHNSKSSVWNGIQDSLQKAGFVIGNVSILDKKKGTITQLSTTGAVKNDLVISAYKPKQSFAKRFLELAGEGLEEEFIKMHLSHLKSEPTIERTEQMLYSKLLAYYVQRSYAVKYDASTFYKMLRANFIEADGYWFNKDQVENYLEFKQKMKLEGIEDLKSGQIMMFIDCEKTAIIWLHTFLDTPKDFQTIFPAFTKIANISGDSVPELMALLDKNLILKNGKYRRPQTEDEKMTVTQKRERELQREFDVLLLEAKGSKKKIKECRKQAVIYGFEQCYKNNRFQDILALGKRLDKKIIENDSEITEFIEVAELKVVGF